MTNRQFMIPTLTLIVVLQAIGLVWHPPSQLLSLLTQVGLFLLMARLLWRTVRWDGEQAHWGRPSRLYVAAAIAVFALMIANIVVTIRH
jgi:hypothetical protein